MVEKIDAGSENKLSKIEIQTSIYRQFYPAHEGYSEVVDALNNGLENGRIELFDENEVAVEFEDWFTTEKLEYITSVQEVNPDLRFTLVATPNVSVNHADIIKSAKAFGDEQPHETYAFEELLGEYTAAQLSGTHPENGKAVVFSLIPNKFDPGMTGTAVQQMEKLAELQIKTTELKVPSVLEAVALWYSLRAQGDSLDNDSAMDKTYIRHFNLPEHFKSYLPSIPASGIVGNGKPHLSYSNAQEPGKALVSLG